MFAPPGPLIPETKPDTITKQRTKIMKKLILAAAATLLVAGSAIAAERSSDGNGHLYGFNPNPQTLLGGQAGGLDFEPTASIGAPSGIGSVMRVFGFDGRDYVATVVTGADGSRIETNRNYSVSGNR